MDKSTLVRIGGGVTAMLMFQSGKPRWRLHTKHLLIQPSYIHRWSQKKSWLLFRRDLWSRDFLVKPPGVYPSWKAFHNR